MRATLRDFIAAGGIPAADAFSCLAAPFADHVKSNVRYPALLNRNAAAGLVVRLRRKALYDLGVGEIALDTRAASADPVCITSKANRQPITMAGAILALKSVSRLPGKRRRVYIGSGDNDAGEELAAAMPDNVAQVLAHNVTVDDPQIEWLPLGRDPAGAEHYDIPPVAERAMLAWANFSIQTHPARARAKTLIADVPFVVDEVQERYGMYYGYRYTQREFYERLRGATFCLCPRGNGIDTYPVWDALSLGVIPIVVREAAFHRHMDELPIFWLSSLDEIAQLTASRLKEFRDEALDREWDFTTLSASHWIARLKGEERSD